MRKSRRLQNNSRTLPKSQLRREEDGQSLAFILCLSVVSSLWVAATMAAVLPTFIRSADLKWGAKCRGDVEGAMDYVLSSMNTNMGQGNNPFECGNTTQSYNVTSIQPSTIGADSNATINVMVQNIALPSYPPANPYFLPMVYDPLTVNLINAGSLPNPYRMLTVGVTEGNITKVLRVFLVPRSLVPNGSSASLSPGQNLQPYAVYGVNNNLYYGSVGVNSYVGSTQVPGNNLAQPTNGQPFLQDPRVRADSGSGTTVNQLGASSVTSTNGYTGMAFGGNQMEYPNPISNGLTAAVAGLGTNNFSNSAPWLTVYGNVNSNFTDAGYTTGTSTQGIVYPSATSAGAPDVGYIPLGYSGITGSSASANAPVPAMSAASGNMAPNMTSSNNVLGLQNVYGTYPYGNTSSGANQSMYGDTVQPASTTYPQVASAVSTLNTAGTPLPPIAGLQTSGQVNAPIPSTAPNGGSVSSFSNYTAPDGSVAAPMGGVVTSMQQYSVPSALPPPGPPAGSVPTNLGNVVMNGTATINIVEGLSPGSYSSFPLGTINDGQTVNIPPGNYYMSGLLMNSGSTINVDSAVTTPSNFWLQGNISTSSSAPAVNIANGATINMGGITPNPLYQANSLGAAGFNTTFNAGITGNGSSLTNTALAITPLTSMNGQPAFTELNGSASLFNLYYSGGGGIPGSPSNAPSTTMAFYGNQRMTVYAPTANVLIGSGSGVTNFYGAVVGNWVTTQGPTTAVDGNYTAVHYDITLKPNGGALINPNQSQSLLASAYSGQWSVTGYKAITWQEPITSYATPTSWLINGSNNGYWQL